jgi:hypothetical protein
MGTTSSTPIGATIDLKPMSLSELLDRTFSIYRNHFWLFCGMMAIPQILITLLNLIHVIFFPVRSLLLAQPNPQDPFAVFSAMRSTLGAGLLILVVAIICFAFASGAVTVAVSEICLGRRPSIKESYAFISQRLMGLLGLILLLLLIGIAFIFIGVFAGAILAGLAGAGIGMVGSLSAGLKILLSVLIVLVIFVCILGGALLGMWFFVRFAVSIPVFVLERAGVVDSLPRSGSLTAGHRWRILGAIVVMYLITYVVQVVFAAPFVAVIMINAAKGLIPVWAQIGSALAGAIGGTLAGPLMMITLTLIYYDVRIRKEAFDLEAMIGALGPSAAGSPAPTPDFK